MEEGGSGLEWQEEGTGKGIPYEGTVGIKPQRWGYTEQSLQEVKVAGVFSVGVSVGDELQGKAGWRLTLRLFRTLGWGFGTPTCRGWESCRVWGYEGDLTAGFC